MSAEIRLDDIVAWFESLEATSLRELERYYAADAWFKDPFNEVRGVAAIRRIFEHMFKTLDQPRFRVTERIADRAGAVLLWEFRFAFKGAKRCIRGASHLRFDAQGCILWHRDYWDAAEEFYATLPLLGWFMRRLQGALRTPQDGD